MQIRNAQKEDIHLQEWMNRRDKGKEKDFYRDATGLIRFRRRVCVPQMDEIKQMILEEAHQSRLSFHPGTTKMYHDLKENFWWHGMKKDVADFVSKCLICRKSKTEHQRSPGELQPLDIPEWKWDSISMDFVSGLPKTKHNHDAVWVIVDRLTKTTHFLPINMKYKLERLAELYIKEIVRLHGIPTSIISDRDPRFTSKFWESLQKSLGTKLKLSSAYHPQTDGQTERTIQTLEDLLRAYVMEHQGAWDESLPLVEFTYNNSFHSSIGMAPYEALYGRKCRTPLCWYETGESLLLAPDLLQAQVDQIKMIREKIKAAQDRQKSYYDKRRKPLEFQVGDHVFLKVSPTTGVGRALKSRKLSPKFIGPFEILKKIGTVAYQLALPPNLSNLHSVFHVSQLRKYIADPSHVIELDPVQVRENLSYEVSPIKVVDQRIKQLRGKTISLVKVIWDANDEGNATWELEDKMKESYPYLFDT